MGRGGHVCEQLKIWQRIRLRSVGHFPAQRNAEFHYLPRYPDIDSKQNVDKPLRAAQIQFLLRESRRVRSVRQLK